VDLADQPPVGLDPEVEPAVDERPRVGDARLQPLVRLRRRHPRGGVVVQACLPDDLQLLRPERPEGHPFAAEQDHTSRSNASPWPPPEQIAARPRPPPFRRSSCTIVARIRAPEAPIGWPSATAPPFTFTRSGSAPSIAVEFSTTDEKASFSSTRS